VNIYTKRLLFWTPRVLGILFAIFISIFALDVFGEGYSLGETVVALLIHLIPTLIIIISLAIAWRWEWIGAVLFTALSLLYIILSRAESWIIPVPLLFIGVLFLLGWITEKRPYTR